MQEQLNAIADQLAAGLPSATDTFGAGGMLGKILALITAIKSGDVMAIVKAVYDLLGEFVQEGGTTNFAAAPTGFGMDMATLLGILGTILSLLAKK